MADLLRFLVEKDLIQIAFIAGLVAIFLAIIGKATTVLSLSNAARAGMGFIGAVLILASVGGFLVGRNPALPPSQTPEKISPTELPPSVAVQPTKSVVVVVTATPQIAAPPIEAIKPAQGLSDCGGFQKNETRVVGANTFVMGDVFVNGVQEFDNGSGEGTVVYFEQGGTILAPYGAGCYTGSSDNLDGIVQQQFESGCGSGCQTVRIVIMRSNGKKERSFVKK